jgi:hypothetical protein
MDPHGNLLKLLSGNSNSMAEILSYYTTCSGANPFEAYAGEMNTELTNAQSTLSSFLATGYIDVQCYDMISTNGHHYGRELTLPADFLRYPLWYILFSGIRRRMH